MTIQFALIDNETWRDVVERILADASDEDKQHCLSFYDEMAKRGKAEKEIAATALFHRGLFPRGEPTPGPWEWSKVDDSTTMLLGLGQDGVCGSILEVSGCRACGTRGRNCAINGTKFDLAIIEAAPELYESLERCVMALGAHLIEETAKGNSHAVGVDWYHEATNLLERIDHALEAKNKE